MLCELNDLTHSLPLTWTILTCLALVFLVALSSLLFKAYYWNPTYDTWKIKSNPKYPPPETVRLEAIQMLKGLAAATLCPALSLWMRDRGVGKGYCGVPLGWGRIALEFAAVWVVVDLYEMLYHRVGDRERSEHLLRNGLGFLPELLLHRGSKSTLPCAALRTRFVNSARFL